MNITHTPRVSVVMPVCNVARYLPQCLDSITSQTLRDIEIICVNAGSDDESGRILDSYAEKDNRIKVIHEKRMDAGAARNIGLDIAGGKYLSVLDSDDYFHPQMLELCMKKAEETGADIVVYKSREYNMASGKTKPLPSGLRIDWCPRNLTFHPSEMKTYLFNAFQNWAWNKFFRREFIEKNNIRFQSVRRTNDMAFTCQALAMAETITVLPLTFANYRTGTGTSLQSTNDVAPTSFWQAFLETKKRLEDCGLYETYRQTLHNTVLSGLFYNLTSVKTMEAKQVILQLIKEDADREFGLAKYKRDYFHNPLNYLNYQKVLKGEYIIETAGKTGGIKQTLKKTAKALLDSDHYRRLRRFLIKINVVKY